MSKERLLYEARQFLATHGSLPVNRRLAFDAWADRRGFEPEVRPRLWSAVKAAARRPA